MTASVRLEIQALVARGAVALEEIPSCSMEEWLVIVPSLADESLVRLAERAVADDDRESIRLYAPELLRRFNGVDAALARMTADYLAACKETYEVRAELQRLRGEGAR